MGTTLGKKKKVFTGRKEREKLVSGGKK